MLLKERVVKADPDAVLRIADRLEPRLRRAFLEALETLREQVPLGVLADAIEAGDISAAMNVIGEIGLTPDDLGTVRSVMEDAAAGTARLASTELGLGFTLVNPHTVRWAERHTGRLITGVSDETQAAVREIVSRAVREGGHPYEQARLVRNIVGLTERDALALDRFHAGLIDEGRKSEQVQRMIERQRNRMLRRRAETIARTETLRAANMGNLLAWREAQDEGLIHETARRVWIVTTDDRLAVVGSKTRIETLEGPKPISAVRPGDYVLTHRDRFCKVLEKNVHRYSGPVVRLHGGGKTHPQVTVTPEHQLWVQREGRKQWVDAKDIAPSDKLHLLAAPCLDCGDPIPARPGYVTGVCKPCTMRRKQEARWGSPENWDRHAAAMKQRWSDPRRREEQRVRMQALMDERGEEITSKALKARARNHLGHSYLERKMMWWLNQQGLVYEPQWFYRWGKEQRRAWADFYLPGPNIVIECDGPHHQTEEVAEQDRRKDAHLGSMGIEVLRFNDEQIREEFVSVASDIRQRCCLVARNPKEIVHRETRHQPAYDLRVDEDESFIAGGIVVHNCARCAPMEGQTIGVNDRWRSNEEATSFGVPEGLTVEDVLAGRDRIQVLESRPLRQAVIVDSPPLHPRCRCSEGLVFD